MNRRTFLRCSGGVALACSTGSSMIGYGDENDAPRLDQERLRARNQNRSTVVAQHGMVCTSHPLATLAGLDMLRAGGSCIDAAVAANAMLGLTEPASNGIGGDLFAILWSQKDQQLYGLNASGRSPYDWNLAAAQQLGLQSIPRQSPLSWSVPGCVSGWDALLSRFGKLGLARCLEPAINYARTGFPLSPIISGHFDFDPQTFPTLAEVYHPGGVKPKYGDVFSNPALARSYEEIARGGADAFYRGRIAEQIVARSREFGGRMSLRDLADHRVDWVQPVSSSYRGWDVWEIPPNGQGIVALQILNMLETFDIGSLPPNSAKHLHLFLEAKKLAFEDRSIYYADPQFASVPVEWLISKEYAKKRASKIDPQHANIKPLPGDPALDSDTVYLTAADESGNMISLIQSVYHGFGSGICPADVGFAMQNRGQAFSLDANHRNRLEPHKRPFHTIIPAFMTRDGLPIMSFGVMGGDFQPQGHAQVVMNVVDFGMSPQQATDQPRIGHTGSSEPWSDRVEGGGLVQLEHGFDDSVITQLRALGHTIADDVIAQGGFQGIWKSENPRRYFGGSDPRKDGLALGY